MSSPMPSRVRSVVRRRHRADLRASTSNAWCMAAFLIGCSTKPRRISTVAQIRLLPDCGAKPCDQRFVFLLALQEFFLSTKPCAQKFPSKPVHVMVGAAPGGLID